MPTYVYEIIGSAFDTEGRQVEIFQRMSDPPLTSDPVSGEPIQRIITGSLGIKLRGLKRSTVVHKRSAAATACGCAKGVRHRRGI